MFVSGPRPGRRITLLGCLPSNNSWQAPELEFLYYPVMYLDYRGQTKK